MAAVLSSGENKLAQQMVDEIRKRKIYKCATCLNQIVDCMCLRIGEKCKYRPR